MDIVDSPAELCAACERARRAGKRVGFVPTMGALHDGHLALVDEARRRADFVVVSIFVNPTQFGPSEDFSRYPRTFEADRARCEASGVDVVFAPAPAAMYVAGDETRVHVGETAAHLCGATRPGHFEGVCTVVAKLFALVGPSVAVFGRKDYQQFRVLSRMVEDLMLPVEVVGLATVREPDGLAMSSRNRYLSERDRARALGLARGLTRAVERFDAGERSAGKLRAVVLAEVEAIADAIDYVAVADAERVVPFADEAQIGERAVVAVAARLGATRLIDNVVLGEERGPLDEGARA
ncbi:MAG: pantoate--beta-alanine ligase [Deltaproteobacteria bacterium]|nr:pantoate--beta-alanine ligase [Deltaproteobacteria bacterium]